MLDKQIDSLSKAVACSPSRLGPAFALLTTLPIKTYRISYTVIATATVPEPLYRLASNSRFLYTLFCPMLAVSLRLLLIVRFVYCQTVLLLLHLCFCDTVLVPFSCGVYGTYHPHPTLTISLFSRTLVTPITPSQSSTIQCRY